MVGNIQHPYLQLSGHHPSLTLRIISFFLVAYLCRLHVPIPLNSLKKKRDQSLMEFQIARLTSTNVHINQRKQFSKIFVALFFCCLNFHQVIVVLLRKKNRTFQILNSTIKSLILQKVNVTTTLGLEI